MRVHDLVARARRVFPGNKWTRGPLQEAWSLNDDRFPKFLARASGCRVWDTRGREFIDFHCSFGAVVLGYGEERVERAAAAALRESGGQILSGPTRYSVELAERLVGLRPGTSWALLAKNGSDVSDTRRARRPKPTQSTEVLFCALVYAGDDSGARVCPCHFRKARHPTGRERVWPSLPRLLPAMASQAAWGAA